MILLSLEGIPGDNQIGKFKKWIAIESVDWEITRELAESAKAGTRDINLGQPEIAPISMEKSMDVASVPLMVQAIAGKALTKAATLVFTQTQGPNEEDLVYLQFKLAGPIVSNWSITGSSDDRPTEKFALEYNKIWMEYTPFDGSKAGTAVQDGWSRVDNQKWAGS